MEEVDEIVIHTLRQVGCDLSEISSLKEFTTETAIEGVVRCLKIITPSFELSHHVPPSMSARYRLGSALATICTELGYKGEIGYQTFLYSNEADLRKIFLFLFEKLPKESEKALDEPLNKTSLIIKEAGSSLSKCFNYPWLPYYCKTGSSNENKFLLRKPLFATAPFQASTLFKPYNYVHINNKDLYDEHCGNYLQILSKQVKRGTCLLSSILQSNTLEYVQQCSQESDEDELSSLLNKKELVAQKQEKIRKIINDHLMQALQQKRPNLDTIDESYSKSFQGSRFIHALELQFTPEDNTVQLNIPSVDSEEDKQKKRDDEIKELQDQVDTLTNELETLTLENKKYETSSVPISEAINKEETNIVSIKEQYRVKKCTLSLLPDAQTNIEKLQSVIDNSSQKVVSLANQWEQHRVPLINEYRDLRELSSRRVNETQRKLEEIKSLREKIKSLGVEARQKDETHKHLVTAFEKLTKDVSRSAYTRRIMEIVANIKKQQSEIDNILLDTRNVQKEINKLSGMLERTFTVTDELIFKDAKKDEAIRRAYKYLAALHENCSQLVIIVEETGAIVRQIREIEDQIEQENQKKVADTLERITSDLKQMQQENASLLAQIK